MQRLYIYSVTSLLRSRIVHNMVSIHKKGAAASSSLGESEPEPYVPNIVRISLSDLKQKAEAANDMYEACVGCGRRCEDNRQAGKLGKCNTGMKASVSSHFPHHGEEDVLRGSRGSGTIFFTNCNLKCVFCQNFDVSQEGDGYENEDEELCDKMMDLQRKGCHNINLVSPTHVVAPILRALVLAKEKGLKLPIVYNTGGYDSPETLSHMNGVVDIYMPDMKYADKKIARRYSKIDNYPEVNQAAVKEMHRQVGDLDINPKTGVANRGMLIRHLVLPHELAGTEMIAHFIANQLGLNTFVNVMAQYRPEHKVIGHDKLGRRITDDELERAIQCFMDRGVARLDHRFQLYNRCLSDKLVDLFKKESDW